MLSASQQRTVYKVFDIVLCSPEEASTQKSAKTHAGNAFVSRDFDLLTSKWVSRIHI